MSVLGGLECGVPTRTPDLSIFAGHRNQSGTLIWITIFFDNIVMPDSEATPHTSNNQNNTFPELEKKEKKKGRVDNNDGSYSLFAPSDVFYSLQ